MEKEYTYEGNELLIGGKRIIFSQKVKKIAEFEKCIVVLTGYSNAERANNVSAFDYDGNELWKLNDVIGFLAPQIGTAVARSVECSEHVNVYTFMGDRFCMEAYTGRILKREFFK